MFEMIVTVGAALFASIYALSQSVLMNGPHKNFYRIALLTILLMIYLIYKIRRHIRYNHLKQLHVEPESYIYYDKYTSPLYRVGYFVSYLIQNIVFDYLYMWRNFNFCKGLDVYEGGVSEYYIKFRSTWYRYINLTRRRHKISLKKLQSYAVDVKNQFILDALDTDEKRAMYSQFSSEAEKYFNEHQSLPKSVLKGFSDYDKIDSYYKKNILKNYKVILYIRKHQSEIVEIVNRMEQISNKDINDFRRKKF